jgi:nucleoside-triphosphatase THEP1/RNase P/RNase MRP subunit POP5
MIDPALLKQNYGSCLIIGKTSSGKTTLVKAILKAQLKKTRNVPIYTINVRSTEYSNAYPNLINVEYEQMDTIPKKSIIIIEDVISMTPFQANTLRQAVNYNAHHKKQKIYVITHHVFKTSVYQLIPYFNYIVFTASHSNIPLVKIILRYFHLSKDEIDKTTNLIHPVRNTPFVYFVFTVDSHRFFKADSIKQLIAGDLKDTHGDSITTNASTSSVTKDELMQRFETFVHSNENKQQASTVFSILINALPNYHNVNITDLTLRCQTPNGQQINISLVDYVISLLTANIKITKYDIFVHNYFKKLCKLPTMFIVNKRYH